MFKGEPVRTAAIGSGAAAFLLMPFIKPGVNWLAAQIGAEIPEGYWDQLSVAITALIMFLAAEFLARPEVTPNVNVDEDVARARRLPVWIIVVLTSGMLMAGCAGNRAPVLVGQSGLAVAQSVGQLQTAGKQLVDAGVITPQIALSYQRLLLQVNDRLKPLPAILDSIDAAQKAGDPTATQLEQALAILKAVSGDLSIVVAGVPLSDATAQVLRLVQATQQLITTLVAQIGHLFPPQAPVPVAAF